MNENYNNNYTFYLLFIYVLISCRPSQSTTSIKSNIKDTSIVITPYSSKCKIFYKDYRDTLFQYDDYQKWIPTISLVLKVDSIAMDCILQHKYATLQLRENLRSPYYLRQYIGIIDSLGDKHLFINYICEKLSESKKFNNILVGLDDGFDCSFDLLFDINTMRCKKINLISK